MEPKKQNVVAVSCPPCGENVALATKRGAYKAISLMSPSIGPADHFLRKGGRLAFTLIELLVAILIIGILAAVAVPQYQKAVVKAKAAKVITLMSTIARAREAKYLETGKYVDNFRALDLDFPEDNACGVKQHCNSNWIYGQDWHIALDSLDAASFGHSITGMVPHNPYFDPAEFVMLQTNPLGLEVQLGKVYCVDAIGEYSSGLCTNVMHGTLETEIDYFGLNMGVYSFN